MTTPLRFDEIAALHGGKSLAFWNAIVRRIVRVRGGEMPADWQARVIDSGLYARVSATWPPAVCLRPRTGDCTAYRRRGPSVSLPCFDTAPGDLSPSTGCEDPRRFDAWARQIRGGVCPDRAAVCR